MKRIFGWVLTIALILGLCACGQDAVASWQEHYDLGVRYLSEGNYEEAIIAFTAAIEIDEKRPEAFIGRGDAYALSGDTEDNLAAALADYEAAIALDETLADAWLGLADVYIRKDAFDDALKLLKTALEKTGGNLDIDKKIAEIESGQIYDSSGQIRMVKYYNNNNEYVGYTTTKYYEQEDVSYSVLTAYDTSGNVIDIGRSEHNAKQRKQIKFSAGVSRDDSHVVLQKFEYYFDEYGRCVLYMDYEEDGSLQQRIEKFYDDAGNLIKEYLWHGYALESNSEEPTYRFEYEYDQNGNKILENRYLGFSTELFDCTKYEYDSNENVITFITYDKNGVETAWRNFTYDKYGNQATDTYVTADGNISRYESQYEYDSNGNIIGAEFRQYYNGELTYYTRQTYLE